LDFLLVLCWLYDVSKNNVARPDNCCFTISIAPE
jgi:hypothetical protein